MRLRRSGFVAATGLLLLGCGVPAGKGDVIRVAQEWMSAAQAHDGAKMCQLLTPAAAESIQGGDQTCEQAIGGLQLPGGGTSLNARLWGGRAQVHTDRDTLFLVQLSDGWRINGAGCQPRERLPYDCKVEG